MCEIGYISQLVTGGIKSHKQKQKYDITSKKSRNINMSLWCQKKKNAQTKIQDPVSFFVPRIRIEKKTVGKIIYKKVHVYKSKIL